MSEQQTFSEGKPLLVVKVHRPIDKEMRDKLRLEAEGLAQRIGAEVVVCDADTDVSLIPAGVGALVSVVAAAIEELKGVAQALRTQADAIADLAEASSATGHDYQDEDPIPRSLSSL